MNVCVCIYVVGVELDWMYVCIYVFSGCVFIYMCMCMYFIMCLYKKLEWMCVSFMRICTFIIVKFAKTEQLDAGDNNNR